MLTVAPRSRRVAISLINKDKDKLVGSVKIIDLDSHGKAREAQQPLPHPQPVWSLAFTPNGHHLYTGCEDRHSRVFEVATGELVQLPIRHYGNVSQLAISADGRRVLSGSSGGGGIDTAKVHTVPRWSAVGCYLGREQPFQDVKWGRDGQLYGLSQNSAVLRLSPTTGEVVKEVIKSKPGPHIFLGHSHQLLSFTRETGVVKVFDFVTGTPTYEVPARTLLGYINGGMIDKRLVRFDRNNGKLRLIPVDRSRVGEQSVSVKHLSGFFSHGATTSRTSTAGSPSKWMIATRP